MNISPFLQDDRYLSAPDSPLVINPFAFEAAEPAIRQADLADRPTLPLSVGVCCSPPTLGLGAVFADACLVYERQNRKEEPHLIWEADFAAGCPFREPDGVQAADGMPDGLHIGIDPSSAHPNDHRVSVALPSGSRCCLLTGTVTHLSPGSKYAVTLREENGTAHCLLYTHRPGSFGFLLEEYTRAPGDPALSVEICVYEGSGHVCTLSSLRLWRFRPAVASAVSFSRRWHPTVLSTAAEFPGKSAAVLTDRIVSPHTVERRLRYRSSAGLVLAGRCDAATFSPNGDLRLCADGVSFKLTISTHPALRFYPDALAFFSGRGTTVPDAQTRFWSAELPPCAADDGLSLRFTEDAAPAEAIQTARERRRSFARWLEQVPAPRRFSTGALSDSPSPETARRAYYTAWAQLWADILPAGKAGGSAGCITTGKASLWAYGAPETPYAASWETFYGLMLLSYPDPEHAWDMYLSYMRQTDENGMLGGESLPSIKARTARQLYSRLPDRKRLSEVLPALERYLQWRLRNLRWIYLNRTPNREEKDLDFAVAALVDISHLIAICRELSLEDKAVFWEERAGWLFHNFSNWFFAPGAAPAQYYYSDSGRREAGIPLVVTKALCLPQLLADQRQALLTLFDSVFDPNLPFGGFSHVKMENMSYTLHGLWISGRQDTARQLAAITVRDIIRSGFFAEEYLLSGADALPSGVRPSLFGCTLLIDCLWFLSHSSEEDTFPPFLLN